MASTTQYTKLLNDLTAMDDSPSTPLITIEQPQLQVAPDLTPNVLKPDWLFESVETPTTTSLPGEDQDKRPSYGSCSSSSRMGVESSANSRAFSKKGFSNLVPANLDHKDWPFYHDIFTTLLDVRWRWLLFAFCLIYFTSWLVFALIWYAIVRIHGDLDEAQLANPDHVPCITNMKDFTSTFLFSVETQHTTGYGFYHITEQCPFAIFTFCAQSIIGVIIEGLMVGLVFVKMARAKKRSATLLFSRNAVISQRDGQLCFMFRVADMRNKSHLLEARVRAQLIGRRVTAEGEEISFGQQELEVSGDGERYNQVLLFLPTVIIHRITPSSPLYRIKPEDLTCDNVRFEIVVVLEGIVETTGLVTQARSSYLPGEILWGHRFRNIGLSGKTKSGNRIVDYSVFHDTVEVSNASGLSAYELDAEKKEKNA